MPGEAEYSSDPSIDPVCPVQPKKHVIVLGSWHAGEVQCRSFGSGPATIAVTPAGTPLPCGLATATCGSQSGLLACIDDLYSADGTCQPNVDETFGHFTALPQANDYSSVCFADSPVPCDPSATELRGTVDAAGNLLLPFNWQGILVNDAGIPVPRLLRGTLRSPLGFNIPDAVFLASYTPEGAKLPPIFEPTADPSVTDPNVITLFGSADAPYTILWVHPPR